MIDPPSSLTISERVLVLAMHHAMRQAMASMYREAKRRGPSPRPGDAFEKVMRHMTRAIDAHTFLDTLMEFLSAYERVAPFQNPAFRDDVTWTNEEGHVHTAPGWTMCTPLFDETCWQRTRDVVLLAFYTYESPTHSTALWLGSVDVSEDEYVLHHTTPHEEFSDA